MDTTRQTFTKESGGWTVYTYVNGVLRCQTWTAGTKRDANDVARRDLLAVTTGRDPYSIGTGA